MNTENNNHDNILYSVNEQARAHNLPTNDQKPCITALLSQNVPEGFRNKAIHIVATDFINRQCKEDYFARIELNKWNTTFEKPLPESEIRAIVAAVVRARSKRTYGCNNMEQLIVKNCLGKSNCPFYLRHFGVKTKKLTSYQELINSRLWLKLSGNEIKLYHTLVRVERKKNQPAGSLLITPLRLLQKESGLTRPTIIKLLPELYFHGLIEYKKGKQHKCNKTASEIRRILPIIDTS